MIKECVVCGKEFEPKRPEYRTCGATCRNRLISAEKAARHLTTQPCVICGVMFTNTGEQKNRRACSVACGKKLVGKLREKKGERVCKTCGEVFKIVPSASGQYCSKKCMYDRNDTTRNCEHCGKPFRSPPSQMRVRTCSVECGYAIRDNRDQRVVCICKQCGAEFLESPSHAGRRGVCSTTCRDSNAGVL